jgi:Excalibur calcium-binding domain
LERTGEVRVGRSALRLFPGAAVTVLAVLLVWGLPSPASAHGDKDCKDFRSQRAAQIFFLKHGGPRRDPDRLDADHDGVACEDNPCPCYRKKHLPYMQWQRSPVDRRK